MSSLLGTTLSHRYRLDERIGSGASSTVYMATDEKLERTVAIKVMDQEVARDSEQLERFGREARAVAQISHVNVVGVIDAGEDAGHPYIVFEHVDGETLKQRIQRNGPLPITEAVAYAIEIARALQAAHQHHIIHRDVKPQNVLIDPESGAAKVTDFGIARTLEEDGLTTDGRVVGTTDYVAPEQALGHPVTGQSDLYSLGIVLYEMLTGELPFKAVGQVAVAMKHVRAQMPDVRTVRPEVSATLAAILDHATAKRTEERYATDEQLISDLEEVLALEISRAGEATEQATSVLRSLPARTRSRVPLAVRRRLGTELLWAGAALAILAVVALLLIRTVSGPANPAGHTGSSRRIAICSSCATAYNPYGIGGTAQNDAQAPLAVDANPQTAWTTQTYFTGQLGKPGVGLYVSPAKPTVVRQLTLLTKTPGFDVTIYGSTTTPDPSSFVASDWSAIGAVNGVRTKVSIVLGSGETRYAHILVWITKLPPHTNYAAINSITLDS